MQNSTDNSELSQFHQTAVLRNGTPIVIRAIRPDDISKVITGFRHLNPESVYSRFFSAKKELSERELHDLRTTNFVDTVVLVAAIQSQDEEHLIGGASYHMHTSGDGKKIAEVAFTIEKEYQGQGLSRQLLAILIALARNQGIQQFEAEVLSGNASMLKVFEHSGLPIRKRREDQSVYVVLDL
jgi:RimJ/RimL family protein N-acetyltransferase